MNTESEEYNVGTILIIIVAIVFALGLALILSDALKVPSYAVSKATHNLGKRQNQKRKCY